MKSYKIPYYHNTQICIEELIEGETLEMKVSKMVETNEPINKRQLDYCTLQEAKEYLQELM